MKVKQAGKRDSVGAFAPWRSFLWDARHRAPRATYPQTRWATSSSAYLVLLRVEIGRFTPGAPTARPPRWPSWTRLCSS